MTQSKDLMQKNQIYSTQKQRELRMVIAFLILSALLAFCLFAQGCDKTDSPSAPESEPGIVNQPQPVIITFYYNDGSRNVLVSDSCKYNSSDSTMIFYNSSGINQALLDFPGFLKSIKGMSIKTGGSK